MSAHKSFLHQEDSSMKRRREERQRSSRFFPACIALILIASGCGQPTPKDTRSADEGTIRDLDAQWSKTAGTRDVDGTVSYYSDDASLLPPNAPLATNKQTIRAVWAELLAPDSSLSWQSSKVDVARSGDLAYSTGAYQMTLKNPQGKLTEDHGKFLEVWKKQADGKWKVVADVYNSDLPAAAPASEKPKPHHHQSHKKGHAKKRSS
jgi:ketosteroid isomerase-like protein